MTAFYIIFIVLVWRFKKFFYCFYTKFMLYLVFNICFISDANEKVHLNKESNDEEKLQICLEIYNSESDIVLG